MSITSTTRRLGLAASRTFHKSTLVTSSRILSTRPSEAVPWFVEESGSAAPTHQLGQSSSSSSSSSHFRASEIPPPPSIAPEPLKAVYETLSTLPVIDSLSISSSSSYLASLTTPSISSDTAVPVRRPQGRRGRRSSSFGGEGGLADPPAPWDWILSARVKAGSEKKGSVNVVLGIVRKTLSTEFPALPVPPKSVLRSTKSDAGQGWGFLDVGNMAIHVLSSDAHAKWFKPDETDI